MIAVDTNILVYAHRRDSPWSRAAQACIRGLAEGRGAWAIPWPCIHEFLAIVTHRRVYDPPSTIEQATEQVDAWMASPTLALIGEADEHWQVLAGLLRRGRVEGPMVHDARVAAQCITAGVRTFLTADRDFSRFPELNVRNPLIEAQGE